MVPVVAYLRACVLAFERHEAEATRAIRGFIHHDDRVLDWPILTEVVSKLAVSRLNRQAADEDLRVELPVSFRK